VSISEREYTIGKVHERIAEAQKVLDQLWDDARRLRQDYGLNMRDRYIERAQEAIVVVRDDFEKNVLNTKPTAKLDRQYEKDLS